MVLGQQAVFPFVASQCVCNCVMLGQGLGHNMPPPPPPPHNNIKIGSQWVSSHSFCSFGKFCLGQMHYWLGAAFVAPPQHPLGWRHTFSNCFPTKIFYSVQKYFNIFHHRQGGREIQLSGRFVPGEISSGISGAGDELVNMTTRAANEGLTFEKILQSRRTEKAPTMAFSWLKDTLLSRRLKTWTALRINNSVWNVKPSFEAPMTTTSSSQTRSCFVSTTHSVFIKVSSRISFILIFPIHHPPHGRREWISQPYIIHHTLTQSQFSLFIFCCI